MKYLLLLLPLFLGVNAHAGHGHQKGGLEACLRTAEAIRAGSFVKVEFLGFSDEGGQAYEIEIKDTDGMEWEFECDADNANIIEIEQEVESASAPLFKSKMKVSEEDARKTATDLYPGEIEEVEYEIEANGAASYEFDIVDKYGVEFKVEVDATSGEIVEVQIEQWEIGEEDTVN